MKQLKFLPEFYHGIESGEKTKTRRPIKFNELSDIKIGRLFYSPTFNSWAIEDTGPDPKSDIELVDCPYGKYGNIHKISDDLEIKIMNIRVENLHEIKPHELLEEGCGPDISKFIETWDKIYKDKGFGWETNPWVWAISFVANESGFWNNQRVVS